MAENRACKGAPTADVMMGCEHAQQCAACGRKVRDDMTEHPFFGFAASGCDQGRAKPFKLDPPPIYDEHYAATQDAEGKS